MDPLKFLVKTRWLNRSTFWSIIVVDKKKLDWDMALKSCSTSTVWTFTSQVGPQLDVHPWLVTHIYSPWKGHLEGVPQSYLGDLRSPWLLNTSSFLKRWQCVHGISDHEPCSRGVIRECWPVCFPVCFLGKPGFFEGTKTCHIDPVIALFPNSSFELIVGLYMWTPLKV